MLIYLAHPIDQANAAGKSQLVAEWVHALTSMLTTDGHVVFNPQAAWKLNGRVCGPEPRVMQIDLHVVRECDLVLALLPAGVPTVGVPIEIERAIQYGRPVVVLTDLDHCLPLAGYGDQVTLCQSLQVTAAAVNALVEQQPVRSVQILVEDETIRFTVDAMPREEISTGQLPSGAAWSADRTMVPVAKPARAYPDDAGIDLTTVGDWTIPVGRFVDIDTQVTGVQLPADTWAMITGRSSTLRKTGLHIPMAVIDPGWRGPLYVGVWNLTDEPIQVSHGTKLAQLICIRNRTSDLAIEVVEKLDEHPRGLSGFGSSGS